MGRTDAFLSTFLQMLVLVPAAISCFLAARNYLKCSARRTVALTATAAAITAGGLAIMRALMGLPMWIGGVGASVVLFVLFRTLTTLDWSKFWAILVGVLAIETFPLQFALIFDAHLHPHSGAAQMSASAALLQLVLALALLAAFAYPAAHAFAMLLDEADLPRLWYLTVLISALFLGANIAVIPYYYDTLEAGRLDALFPWLETVALALLILIYLLFYRGAHLLLESADLREQAAIYEREAHQYELLRAYMDETARIRHDFRHSVHALNTLAHKGDLEAVQEYLATYAQTVDDTQVVNLCRNNALNALFGYYASQAAAIGTVIRWDLELPDPLPFSEVALSSLFGNLLDNAISGCRRIPESMRRICLSTAIHGSSLYIAATNTFDGTVRKDKHGYLSVTRNGRGTGLRSIASVARQYGGYARFSNTAHEFLADIVLQIPPQ